MRRAHMLIFLALLLSACSGAVATQPSAAGLNNTQAPATVTQAPATVTQAPTATTKSPASVTEAQAATTEAPATVTESPASVTESPAATTEASVATTEAPAAETQAAAAATDTPASPAEPPLDPQAQAPALLPQFAGDLGRAGEWNRYTIRAAIDPQARTITGHERLEYTNRDSVALDRIYFHLYPNLPDFAGKLTVSALTVDGKPVDVVYETKQYLLRVNLPQPLAPGATTAIAFEFSTTAPENASAKAYGAFDKEPGLLTLASSYPIAAIVRGGAWDIGWPDPKGDFVNSETALYDVTLSAPADWKLVTTGVALDTRQDGGQQTARFVSGPQRDFMIAATQFPRVSADVDGTRVNSYYRAEHAPGGQGALDAAARALRVFNKRYGAYPLAELDIVEIDAQVFLGVEYPGMIEIDKGQYDNPGDLEITVAHEVAHQWWYSQVGNDVQTESWLDEALASYSQIIYQEEVRGRDAAEQELDGFRARYRRALDSGRDAPVDQPNTRFNNNYVLLVYGKAVLFFQALRKQIGDEAFNRFLQTHYANHRYGYISGADLLGDAEGACGCDLKGLYADWITKAAPVEVP